jgi:hypothetical protein
MPMHLFENAKTVFITEGEKDAVTITDLKLDEGEQRGYTVAVGTTSGGPILGIRSLRKT